MSKRDRKGHRNRAIRRELETLADENSSLPQPTISFTSWEGPVPPPEALSKYGEIDPAFPKIIIEISQKIIDMAASQASHRQGLEMTVVEGGISAQRRGQVMAFVLALIVIGAGTVFIWNGKSVEGIVAIVISLGGLLTVFLVGKAKTRDERAERFKAIMKRRG